MRDLPIEIQTYVATQPGVKIRQLLWIIARNRSTGAPEEHGLWSGEDHQVFTVDGEGRTYYGVGQFIDWGQLQVESTLNIRKLSAAVSAITPEVEEVLRTFDPKFAPVQVHLAFFDPETNNLVGNPYRVFKGWIDKFPVRRPANGSDAQGTIDMVGHTRILTRQLALKRSDETQRQRAAGDTFYNDVAITGQVQTPWGEKSVAPSGGGTNGRNIAPLLKGSAR